MAVMIPDRLRGVPRVTAGEARLFDMLRRKLPDEALVWFNVPVRGRYPDFVVLDPRRGLLVLEVKDWRIGQVKSMSPLHVTIETPRGQREVTHPLRQARDYALSVVDTLAADPRLVCAAGPYRGRLAVPFGHGVVWTRVREREFRDALPELVEQPMLFRESLAADLPADVFVERLFSLLPFSFPCSLSREQVDAVRYRLFPEVRLPRPRHTPATHAAQPRLFAAPAESVAVMDLEQERLAKRLGDGHRLLRGVAGSGKTITLVCRARLLAALHPHWRILVVCYNVSLAAYLRRAIATGRGAGTARVDVVNFHSLLARLARAESSSTRPPDADGSEWADTTAADLLAAAECGRLSLPRYDAILVDEAQDFQPSWLRLVVEMLNPETNSLFVVHDSAQNIYRKGFSFRNVGIEIRGRTRVLKTNYRNTREIAELASEFLGIGVAYSDPFASAGDESQFVEVVRPQSTSRSGPRPLLVGCSSFAEECAEAAARVKHWIERGHFAPAEVLVLYVRRGPAAGSDRYIRTLLGALDEAGVPHEWFSRDRRSKSALRVDAPTVKVSTIHSAKGLDFAAVALVGLSALPSAPEREDAERRLAYVGLTRARDMLLVTYSRRSQFVAELLRCGELVTTRGE